METGLKQRWSTAWKAVQFKKQVIIGLVLLTAVLVFFPFFFAWAEQRHGHVMNDLLLQHFQPVNVSNWVFGIIWITALLGIIRSIHQPEIFLLFLWGFVCLCLLRIVTITLVPLDPPIGLIELRDPLSNTFYGAKFITKDLFFSGHTSTMFLIFLLLPQKRDKTIALTATILVGILVLVQHVHYTLDVLAAPVFTFLVFVIAKKITANTLKSLP